MVKFRPDRPRQLEERQPSSQEMDIFEQQEMGKSQPQVKNKLNEWYNWLVSHVPKPIKEKPSSALKTFKDKIIGLYKGEECSNLVAPAGHQTEEPAAPAAQTVEPQTTINLIVKQTHIRSSQVTGSLNQDVSNLILDTIHPDIQM